MASDYITINGPDGDFKAYCAKPGNGQGPALIVIQEIFGINKVMRDICDGLAEEGYIAICPDLFWRIEPGIELTDQTEEEWSKAFELFNKFDVEKGIHDIGSTISHARKLSANGKVGAVGYCLGGLLSYLTACRTDADACVGYYGVNIPAFLEGAAAIKGRLMLHIAGQDQFVDAEAQAKMHAGLESHPHVTLHDYPDQDHAFARVGGEHFDADAARIANTRTRDFLKTHLG